MVILMPIEREMLKLFFKEKPASLVTLADATVE
jgi:hypothetical protein